MGLVVSCIEINLF